MYLHSFLDEQVHVLFFEVCCSVLLCIAVCCSVLQCVAVCCGRPCTVVCICASLLLGLSGTHSVCCSVLHCLALCCACCTCFNMLHFAATSAQPCFLNGQVHILSPCVVVCDSALQNVEHCCRVLHTVAECCSA